MDGVHPRIEREDFIDFSGVYGYHSGVIANR